MYMSHCRDFVLFIRVCVYTHKYITSFFLIINKTDQTCSPRSIDFLNVTKLESSEGEILG